MIYQIDAKGRQCPIPVVETKKALAGAAEGDVVETLVDNEIAVQNLEKMAAQKGLVYSHTQEGPGCWRVRITAGGAAGANGTVLPAGNGGANGPDSSAGLSNAGSVDADAAAGNGSAAGTGAAGTVTGGAVDGNAGAPGGKGTVVVISADHMGEGDEGLGRLLVKSFLYALTSRDELPETLILYNGGAKLSVEGAETLEDLKVLEAGGVEILTCGTCLNHYGLTEKLRVGSVSNMYAICEKLMTAAKVVKI